MTLPFAIPRTVTYSTARRWLLRSEPDDN